MGYCFRCLICCCRCFGRKNKVKSEPEEFKMHSTDIIGYKAGKQYLESESRVNDNKNNENQKIPTVKRSPDLTITPLKDNKALLNDPTTNLDNKIDTDFASKHKSKNKETDSIFRSHKNLSPRLHLNIPQIAQKIKSIKTLVTTKVPGIKIKAPKQNKSLPNIRKLELVSKNNEALQSEKEKFLKKLEDLQNEIIEENKKREQETSKLIEKNENDLKKIVPKNETYQTYELFENRSKNELKMLKLSLNDYETEILRLNEEIIEPLPLEIFKKHQVEVEQLNKERIAKSNRIALL